MMQQAAAAFFSFRVSKSHRLPPLLAWSFGGLSSLLPAGGIMTTTTRSVRLAGSVLDRSRHVCAFFHSKDEEYNVLLPFIAEGFDHGDKAYHIVDSRRRPEHRRRLQAAGIDTAAAERRGQLDIRAWEDAYLRDGRFNQQRMLALIEQVLTGGKAQGYSLTRLVANMEWALEDRPGVEDLVEYETRLNYVLPKYDDAVC
jgi:hypothetical protein